MAIYSLRPLHASDPVDPPQELPGVEEATAACSAPEIKVCGAGELEDQTDIQAMEVPIPLARVHRAL